ncbi:MAG: PilZ domain-containing protein [Tissierellaceae bacterium]|nr:PilZ domain-containing protein [Tissierellaceae bacterium]
MYINELSFDSFIEVEIFSSDIESEIRFNTRVDSVKGGILKAVIPRDLRWLSDIDSANVYYKKDGKCKKWTCQMIGYEKSNLVQLIVLSCNSEAENINNRGAFRLRLDDDIYYKLDDVRFRGRYKDLSARGIGFYSNKEHKIGDKIDFLIEDMEYRIEVNGLIVRREEQNQKRNVFKFLYGIKFQEENEEIMSYIFKKQSELIRKRKRSIEFS